MGWQGLLGGSPRQNGSGRASHGPHAHLKCTGAAERRSSFFLKMYTQHPTEGYFKCFPPRFVVTLKSAVMILSFPFSAGNERSSGSRTEVIALAAQQVSSLPSATARTTCLPFQTLYYVCRAPASATACCGTLREACTVSQSREGLKPLPGIGLPTGIHSPVRKSLAFTFSNFFISLPKTS